jgi:hypothetical protein
MKLYWRVKINGKWTWRPAVDVGRDKDGFICVVPHDKDGVDEDGR